EAAQQILGQFECSKKRLALDDGEAEIHQLVHMGPIARARIDRQIGKMCSHHFRYTKRAVDLIDGEHESTSLVGARRAQDIEAACIAVVDLRAEAPHKIHL